MTQRLDTELFRTVVAHTPLISIDLIVRNPQGLVLLGQRVNRPAQGYWFVPGGRVRKNERLAEAFNRLVQEELGLISCNMQDVLFLGPFEHFYADNFSGDDFQPTMLCWDISWISLNCRCNCPMSNIRLTAGFPWMSY